MTGYYHKHGAYIQPADLYPSGASPASRVLLCSADSPKDTLVRTRISGYLMVTWESVGSPTPSAPNWFTTIDAVVGVWCDKGEAGSPLSPYPFTDPDIPIVWQASLTPGPVVTDPYNPKYSSVTLPVSPSGVATSEAQRAGRNGPTDHAPNVYLNWSIASYTSPPILGFDNTPYGNAGIGVAIWVDTIWKSKS